MIQVAASVIAEISSKTIDVETENRERHPKATQKPIALE